MYVHMYMSLFDEFVVNALSDIIEFFESPTKWFNTSNALFGTQIICIYNMSVCVQYYFISEVISLHVIFSNSCYAKLVVELFAGTILMTHIYLRVYACFQRTYIHTCT